MIMTSSPENDKCTLYDQAQVVCGSYTALLVRWGMFVLLLELFSEDYITVQSPTKGAVSKIKNC